MIILPHQTSDRYRVFYPARVNPDIQSEGIPVLWADGSGCQWADDAPVLWTDGSGLYGLQMILTHRATGQTLSPIIVDVEILRTGCYIEIEQATLPSGQYLATLTQGGDTLATALMYANGEPYTPTIDTTTAPFIEAPTPTIDEHTFNNNPTSQQYEQ